MHIAFQYVSHAELPESEPQRESEGDRAGARRSTQQRAGQKDAYTHSYTHAYTRLHTNALNEFTKEMRRLHVTCPRYHLKHLPRRKCPVLMHACRLLRIGMRVWLCVCVCVGDCVCAWVGVRVVCVRMLQGWIEGQGSMHMHAPPTSRNANSRPKTAQTSVQAREDLAKAIGELTTSSVPRSPTTARLPETPLPRHLLPAGRRAETPPP